MDKDRIKIETKRLFIRVVKSEDVTDEYVSGLNDPEVNKYMCSKGQRQTIETVRAYVNGHKNSSNSILLGLFTKNHNRLIGTVGLSSISYFHYCMGLGICLFLKDYWRKGLGCEALIGIKNYVFSEMGFHFIEAGIYDENISSAKLFERAGFECYQHIEDKYRYEDRFVKVLVYRAINHNFKFPLREGCDEYIGTGRN
jgi:RimJ/RimL family protein N-acetyltransferase